MLIHVRYSLDLPPLVWPCVVLPWPLTAATSRPKHPQLRMRPYRSEPPRTMLVAPQSQRHRHLTSPFCSTPTRESTTRRPTLTPVSGMKDGTGLLYPIAGGTNDQHPLQMRPRGATERAVQRQSVLPLWRNGDCVRQALANAAVHRELHGSIRDTQLTGASRGQCSP